MGPEIKILRHIPQSYLNDLQLTQYVVGIVEGKNTSQIINKIRQTNEMFKETNDEAYSFLKKVKKIPQTSKNKILCCLNEDNEYKNHILQEIKEYVLGVEVEKLPKYRPLTKKQFEEWQKLWPINFSEPEFSREVKHSPGQLDVLEKLKSSQVFPASFFLINNVGEILIEESTKCLEGSINHGIMNLLQKWPKSEEFQKKKDDYYYLTGLKLIAREKVCGMCSMALVHSRLHSLYLYDSNPSQIMDQILNCRSLNHRVCIFKVIQG